MTQGRHIFLSYRSTEADFALKLAASLKNAGINLWMDRLDIRPGDDWRKEIVTALNSASAVIAVLSPSYIASSYCQRELARADRLGRVILPILLGPVNEAEWPLEIERQQYIDFSQWQKKQAYSASFRRLFDIIRERVTGVMGEIRPEYNYLTSLSARLETERGMIDHLERQCTDLQATQPEYRFGRSWIDTSRFVVVESAVPPDTVTEGLPIPGYRAASMDIHSIMQHYPRWVLLGEPGSGKSAVLHYLTQELARTYRAQASGHSPLPLLLNLAKWRDNDDFMTFVRQYWSLQQDPFQMMQAGEVVVFIDGLSDMSSQRSRKINILRRWLQSSHAPRQVIFTCRTADYSAELGLDLVTVYIDTIQPEQVRRFAQHYLNTDEAYAFAEQVARYQGEMNAYTLSALMFIYLFKPQVALPQTMAQLLHHVNVAMWECLQLGQVFGTLTFSDVIQALSRLAQAMISNGAGVTVPLQFVLPHLGDKYMLQAAQQMHCLSIQGGMLRFTQQCLLDYFAALAFESVPPPLNRPQLDARGAYIPTRWEAMTRVQGGLVSDPDTFLLEIAQINPVMAVNALAAGAVVTAQTHQTLVDRLLKLTSPPSKDVRLTIAPALAGVDMPQALAMLTEVMQAGPWGIRAAATLMLWGIPEHQLAGLPDLIQALQRAESLNANALKRLGPDVVALLVRLLSMEDRRIRRNATLALGVLRDVAAVPGLVQMLEDRDSMVAEEATRSLSLIRDTAAIPYLITTFEHMNMRVRKAAALALGQIGEPALKPLLAVMKKDNDTLTCLTVDALKNMRVPHVTDILLDLTQAPSAEVCCAAICALEGHNTPVVIQRLTACLNDERPTESQTRICDEAARVLGTINAPAAQSALGEWKMSQEGKLQSLLGRKRSASTAKQRLKSLTSQSPDYVPPAIDEDGQPLQQSVTPPAPPVDYAPPPAPPAETQRPAAPVPVGQPGEILEKLIRDLHHDSLWGQREDAAKALRSYTATLRGTSTAQACARLVQLLAEPDWVLRWAAAEALASLGDRLAVPGLMPMVQDENWTVRIAAIRALLELGDAAAVPALIAGVNDTQSLVREAVAEALGYLAGPQAFSGISQLVLDDEPFVRLAAVKSLPKFAHEAETEMLALSALKDVDANVRWAAAHVLGQVGTSASVEILGDSLADEDGPYWENEKISDLAAAALLRINTPEAQALLQAYHNDQA